MSDFVTFRCLTASGKAKDVTIRQSQFSIGRSENCGLRMMLPDVSRRHCLIETTEFGIAFTDLRPPRPDDAAEDDAPDGILHGDVYERKGMLAIGEDLVIGSTRLILVNYAGYAPLEDPDAGKEQVKLEDSAIATSPFGSNSATRMGVAVAPPPRHAATPWSGVVYEKAKKKPKGAVQRMYETAAASESFRFIRIGLLLVALAAAGYMAYLSIATLSRKS